MKSKLILILTISVSLLSSLIGQNILPPGYPDRSPNLDILPGFEHPPKGYGEVSFYWWLGDTLTKERILSQLDQLENKSITGLQINYCHSDKGGATYGLTYPSQPALFSEKWWELFKWFLKEAKKRDMSVSLSDYTLGAAGQGWYIDEMLEENTELYGSKLESKQIDIEGNRQFKTTVPENLIDIAAYRIENGNIVTNKKIDLKYGIKNSELFWDVPFGDWKVIMVYKRTITTSFDPMNPLSGKKVVEKFFQRFEDHCPGESGQGLNFFFSDELQFGIRGFLWNDIFACEFKKRKGYDIIPELSHLFADISPRSYKIRLDYNDVMVALSEEGFFKTLYDWHTSRGMLFGCDHGGRGKDVSEFGDYFRTQRWMSGPGCDQPGLRRDIVKNKVASSIAHLYKRPRTWLEGFYGSGWGTSSEEIADATYANFAMGHNLLSLHALYYTTYGSWWEWAAPDNHFRQPYWQDMGPFLKCSERLSYVLSQGYHRCDVAMVYPVAPVEANLDGKKSTQTAFTIAENIYPAGIDFDFIDFESLRQCKVINKELNVSGEKYKVLILPSLSAVRYSTIEKALEFFRSGGIVIAVGSLPQASDRIGGNDNKLQKMIKEMFGTTFSEQHDLSKLYTKKNTKGGIGLFFTDPMRVVGVINNLIHRDFKILSGNHPSNVLHRKIGNRDLYFVYGVPKGTECLFRCNGKVELWNPVDGSTTPLKVKSSTTEETVILLPLEKNEPQLIVFSPGTAEIEKEGTPAIRKETIPIEGDWEFELKPTLDNRYGDYRLPAFEGKIGIEVLKLKYSPDQGNIDWTKPEFNDSEWITEDVSYGPQFWKLGPLPNNYDSVALEATLSVISKIKPDEAVRINGKDYYWQPYEFSWRWGLKNDVGYQGYHGMKGRVNDENISLGEIRKTPIHIPTYPYFPEEEGATSYYLWSNVNAPDMMKAKIIQSGILPTKIYLNKNAINAEIVSLHKGNNPLLLKYNKIGRGLFIFEKQPNDHSWKQTVPLATSWYLNLNILPFNHSSSVERSSGCYRFISPPGMRSIFITSKTKPIVWIGGKEYICEISDFTKGRFVDPNLITWKVSLPRDLPGSTIVAMKLDQLPGLYGGAAIPEPIVINCGKGQLALGDLGEVASLKYYSGGMWYRKIIRVDDKQANSSKVLLHLGKLVASAEVFVNGASVGSKFSSPWIFDITGKLQTGENRIEILVNNTLGNHYLSTPSQYVGRTNSGLIGPVHLEYVL